MYQVKVNDKYSFEIEAKNEVITVNDKVLVVDHVQLNAHTSHLLYDHKSYTVEMVEIDATQKMARVKVNGTIYSLTLTDRFDLLLKQLGLENLAANKIQQVKAPMPALVLSVLVGEGQEVKKGDNLLVLEAMKMENMIKSPTDGTIKKIEVKQGDKIEKNTLLVQFS